MARLEYIGYKFILLERGNLRFIYELMQIGCIYWLELAEEIDIAMNNQWWTVNNVEHDAFLSKSCVYSWLYFIFGYNSVCCRCLVDKRYCTEAMNNGWWTVNMTMNNGWWTVNTEITQDMAYSWIEPDITKH